ncbi:MAG: MFS transporter [Promethearchaeota archaeon]
MAVVTETGKIKKLSWKEKLAYASGNLPGGFFASFTGALTAFYYTWMGLNAKYIIIGQIFYMIWNVANDPIFGFLEDRTRTKKGRYLPWIKRSALPFTIGFFFLFFPPQGWRYQTGGATYQIALLMWYLVAQWLYDTFFTSIYIAYVALAPQMTFDQKERTELNGYSSIMALIGMGLSMAFPLMFLTNPDPAKIRNFQITVIIFGLLAILPWIWIMKVVKEKQEFIPKETTPFWTGVKYVFTNKSGLLYMYYDGISVAVINALLTGMFYMFSWIFGAQDANTSGNYMIYFFIPVIFAVIGIPIQLQIGKRYSVKTALSYSLWTEGIGGIIAYLGIITSNNLPSGMNEWLPPSNLWLVSVGLSILFLGFSGDFIFHNVMRADTIDYDELKTGERREAVYAGVACLFGKALESVIFALIPFFLKVYGLIPTDPNSPVSDPITPSQGIGNAIIGVATGVFLLPGILALLGAIGWIFYPLNAKRLTEMRVDLAKLHEKKRRERL